MRFVASGLVLSLFFLTIASSASQEKKKPTNKEKIIGKWKLTKVSAGGRDLLSPLAGTIFGYTKKGKLNITEKIQGKEKTTEFGTYAVDGEVLKVTPTLPGGLPHTMKITKLTDMALVTEKKKQDETLVEEYVRVK